MVAAGALEAVPNADEVKKANSEDSVAAADSTQILVGDMENITGHMNENQQIASDLKKETEVFKKL